MLRKLSTPILVVVILAQLLAPFTITSGVRSGIKNESAVAISINKAEAAENVYEPPRCTGPGWFEIHVGGCIAQLLYYLFYKTTSLVFELAGKIMDFTLMYSLKDTSYKSPFIVEGWGIIRDFCNMFFIFILLYIAIGTILHLNSVKTKEMIINVVIIGLLINFSLFATRVIIDASNILARVFYNPNTIVITDEAGTSAINKPGSFDEIQLSAAIVSKVDPQKIVLNSNKAALNNISSTAKTDDTPDSPGGLSAGTYIILILLATAVNVVGIIVFASCAFIFIGRVVMLWIAMILAPLAFFSYTVPAMQGIKMIGWKNWWKDTLSMAFLAPVFVFFMYIIVGFMDKGLSVILPSLTNAKSGLDFIIGVTVPFIFIMVLLMQAKSIAVKMSGEVGAALSKAGAAVGGVAMMAATGGAAMAMRGSLGRAGTSINESEKLKAMEAKGGISGWGAKQLRNIGKGAGSASYDVRNTKAGAGAAKGLGIESSIGKAKQGGYAKAKADRVQKDLERSKKLEVGENSPLKQNLNKHELALKQTQRVSAPALEEIDKKLEAARQRKNDTKAGTAENDAVIEEIRKLNAEKNNINAGGEIKDSNGKGTGRYYTHNGNIGEETIKQAETSSKAATADLAAKNQSLADATTNETNAQNALSAAKAREANTANKTIDQMRADAEATKKADDEYQKAVTEKANAVTAVTDAQKNEKEASDLHAKYLAEKTRIISSGGEVGHSTKEINVNIRDAKTAINTENTDRHFDEAERITTGFNKFARKLTGSWSGAKEAAQKIRMDTKIDVKK